MFQNGFFEKKKYAAAGSVFQWTYLACVYRPPGAELPRLPHVSLVEVVAVVVGNIADLGKMFYLFITTRAGNLVAFPKVRKQKNASKIEGQLSLFITLSSESGRLRVETDFWDKSCSSCEE